MTRLFYLLLLLPLIGCQPPGASAAAKLTPVTVDEAAAYPSQEPGTKPPVLTGFTPLTKEQLDEGWVQLFDDVSTYGWSVSEGEGMLSVMSDGTKNYLVFDQKGQGQVTISHRFSETVFKQKGNSESREETGTWQIFNEATGKQWLSNVLAKPNNAQPLTESDWKPASGASEATWTADGVLELTGGSGMVETVREYGDFVLQLEYFTDRVSDGDTGKGGGINSGVFFRCIPGENMNGYECQILNSPPDADYKSFIGTDTGGLFRRQVGRNVGAQDGEWNYLTIAVRGADMATWVNGIQVTDWTDTRPEHENPRNGKRLLPGTIQLQGHDPSTKILFRNFRVAEL